MSVKRTVLIVIGALAGGAAAGGAITAGMSLSMPTMSISLPDLSMPSISLPAALRWNKPTAPPGPAATTDLKGNRLTPSTTPAQRFEDFPVSPSDILRSSFDSIGPESSQPSAPAYAPIPNAPLPPSKRSKLTNPLLNDAQIAAIKQRLKLTPAQEVHWPGVVTALNDVIVLHEAQKRQAKGGLVKLDGGAPELQRLRAAATPLFAKLRTDQKNELRMLARIIGLESVIASL